MSAPVYAELAAASCFSFLRGASFPGEMVQSARLLGCAAIGIADRNTLAGVVRAHEEAGKCGIPLVVGARIAFADGTPDILAYPEDREGYARLTRLLTLGSTREGGKKGDCTLSLDDLVAACGRAVPGGDVGARPRIRPVTAWSTSRPIGSGWRRGWATGRRMRAGSIGWRSWRRRRGRSSWPPTTSSTTRPSAGRCRTC